MQQKLTLSFIAFAFIPLILVLQWVISYVHRDQVFMQAGETSRLIKTQLYQQVRERERDLQSVSLNQIFWEHRQDDPVALKEELTEYSNALVATHPEYKLVLLVDQQGVVQVVNSKDPAGHTLETQPLLGKNFERSSWFQKALITKEPFIETPKKLEFMQDLYKSEGLTFVPVAKAIRNHEGQVNGVWVIFTDAAFLKDILAEAAAVVSAPGYFAIYDNQGTVVSEHSTLAGKELQNYETATELINFEGHEWSIKSHLQEESILDYLKFYFWPVLAALGLIILYAFVAARRLTIPLQRLINATEKIAKGEKAFEITGQDRKDEYGVLARSLSELQKIRSTSKTRSSEQLDLSEDSTQATAQKIEDTVQLINGLSAQANMLALNASMEAVKAHHLDVVAEKANELAQRTSYNSQELLRKLNEIKAVCDDMQRPETHEVHTIKR
jgi:HAMP domain-containing protein